MVHDQQRAIARIPREETLRDLSFLFNQPTVMRCFVLQLARDLRTMLPRR